MANQTAGAGPRRDPTFPRLQVFATIAIAAVLAGCASSYHAPIVHRAPPTRAPAPVAATPAPGVPSATAPAPGTVPPGAAPSQGAPGVETVPIPRSAAESRPLPGSGGFSGTAPASVAPNLLKTEPKALKQPYSDAALAKMTSAAGVDSAAPAVLPPLASAPPSAPPKPLPVPTPAPAGVNGYIWPASGEVTQAFAQPRSMGMLIAGKPGDPIVAVADGRVIFSGPGPRTYGNLVILKHADETMSVYGNNRVLLVKEGQSVKRGQRIAELGNSGSDKPQLRFEIRKDGKPVDPQKYLPGR